MSAPIAWSFLVDADEASYLPNCQTNLAIDLHALSQLSCNIISHRALYNRRNLLHYLIPQILGAFLTMKKIIFFVDIEQRLFLNNVKVESFVQCRNGGIMY